MGTAFSLQQSLLAVMLSLAGLGYAASFQRYRFALGWLILLWLALGFGAGPLSTGLGFGIGHDVVRVVNGWLPWNLLALALLPRIPLFSRAVVAILVLLALQQAIPLMIDAEDLAREAAATIAHLEAERDATAQTIANYTAEIARLRDHLTKSQGVLAQLKRGQRIAEANDKAHRAHGQITTLQSSNLEEAAATLQRLQERQAHSDATMAAMEELSVTQNADAMSDRLANAGYGAPKVSSADDVLARLKAKKTKSKS